MTDHHTRAPHQPTAWTLVEQTLTADGSPLVLQLVKLPEVGVHLVLTVAGQRCAYVAFDDLVKANTRIDPDHASVAEQQIATLRHQLAVAEGRRIELETRLAVDPATR